MKSTLRNVFVGGCLMLCPQALAADPEGARMAAPHFGTVQLTSGFVQDPYPVGVIGGGTVPAADFVAGCPGFLGGDRPDLVLDFQAGNRPLHLMRLPPAIRPWWWASPTAAGAAPMTGRRGIATRR